LIQKKKSNTIFIFDWDDTLMCTSYFQAFYKKNPDHDFNDIKAKLKNLDENISLLLKKCLEKGIVFIITNSAPGWVEFCSTLLLPLTWKILPKLIIISAKSLYSKKYPGEPKYWKMHAFKYAINKYNINKKLISNIITVGDSFIDLEAIQYLKNEFRNPFVKIIKFKENPHPLELQNEIWIVISKFDYIMNKPNNFSMKISKKKSE
jgi:hypothetical protein